jgi:tRNA 2-thiouridine synthesizing protein A
MITLDNRGLEPPNPMMRTLAALEELPAGETLMIINDRKPMFLFAELDERGYDYSTAEHSGGGFEITIRRKG